MGSEIAEESKRIRELVIRELLPRWIEEEPALRERMAEVIKNAAPGPMSYEELLE